MSIPKSPGHIVDLKVFLVISFYPFYVLMNHSEGHEIGQVRVVFQVVPSAAHIGQPLPDRFLTYIHRFDIVPQLNPSRNSNSRGCYPEASSSMYILKRAQRTDNTLIGGVVPLQQIRGMVNLVPRFGEKADRRLTKMNCLAFSREFWLNKYFDKETFYALDSM